MKIEDFYTRSEANEGVEVKLKTKEGADSGEWLRVLNRDSDVFRIAQSKFNARVAKIDFSDKTESEIAALQNTMTIELVSTLVHSWSFDVECSSENVIKLLTEAPNILDMVERVGGSSELYFTKKKLDSLMQSKPVQKSTGRKKAVKKRSGGT